MERPDWHEYFFNIAKVVASRSTCFRNKVGAVIVKDKNIISTGYNGAPSYQPNCQEIGFCYREKNQIKSGTNLEKCRAVGSHAEANAIILAAKNGSSTNGASIYIVGHNFICAQCKAMISNAGIKYVRLLDLDNGLWFYDVENDWNKHPIDKE